MKMKKKYYHIDKKDIYFFKFLLEAYEGIAVLETIDSKDEIILLYIADRAEDTVNMIIAELAENTKIYQLAENDDFFKK